MQDQRGFTLIELTIVILISGLLIGLFGNFLVNYNTTIKQKKVQSDLELISESIQRYLEANGKLPCPARFTDTTDDADFGREVDTVCTNVNGATAGVLHDATGGGVVTGSVPVRSINIPDEYIEDPWGMRYSYAVSALQASEGTTYLATNGAISILDGNGNSLIQPAGNGSFVILSHGKNKIGGYTVGGVLFELCTTSGSVDERENCNGDATFLNTLLTSDDAASYFDDFLAYETGTFLAPRIPAGAVMAFDLTACPTGWSAFSDAVGRTIVGVGTRTDYTAPAATPTATASNTFANFSLNTPGGSPYVVNTDSIIEVAGRSQARYNNMNPYIPLLYCRKN